MANHDTAATAYLRLAVISHERNQGLQRNKFLVLGGMAALQAGRTIVAERCRQVVLGFNPAYILKRWPNLKTAFAAEEFQTYYKQLLKFCSYERAEHLLTGLGENTDVASPETLLTWLDLCNR